MLKLAALLSCGVLLLSTAGAGTIHKSKKEKKLYIGSNSSEAIMEFTGVVEYESTRTPQTRTLEKVVEAQLEHMVGPMSFVRYTAVPKGDHTISDVKILAKKGNFYHISYNYKGTIVLENGPKDSYEIFLPVDPSKIYDAAMVGDHNPCTDEHYQSEGDFWYFWYPNQAGCKLKEGKDYLVIKTKIKRFENTKITYPEYQNLPDDKGNITIHVLFGMDDPSEGRDPLKSSDTNAYNYRAFRSYLLKNGYSAKKWTDKEVMAIAKTLDGDAPFVETIQKGKVIYRFFFAPTGIDEDSLGFHWFYKNAIENASVMMYEGHSGLGGHLDLDSIEENLETKIKFNTKRYQIFFFDSCTSYRYYNAAYLARKVNAKDPTGSKKLDIFTNGLSTAFDAMPAASVAIDKAIDYAVTGKGFASYQTLAKQIDSDNLFGIVGDEDNVAPQKIK